MSEALNEILGKEMERAIIEYSDQKHGIDRQLAFGTDALPGHADSTFRDHVEGLPYSRPEVPQDIGAVALEVPREQEPPRGTEPSVYEVQPPETPAQSVSSASVESLQKAVPKVKASKGQPVETAKLAKESSEAVESPTDPALLPLLSRYSRRFATLPPHRQVGLRRLIDLPLVIAGHVFFETHIPVNLAGIKAWLVKETNGQFTCTDQELIAATARLIEQSSKIPILRERLVYGVKGKEPTLDTFFLAKKVSK